MELQASLQEYAHSIQRKFLFQKLQWTFYLIVGTAMELR
jgi:hypothetical protein